MKTPVEQSPAVIAALEELMARDADIISTAHLVVHDRLLLPDLFVAAVLNRSLQLLHGFSDLVRARNYLSATPLFRLQLDNAIRLWAGALAPSFDDFTNAVIRGDQIKKMMSRDGMPMTDKNLVKSLAENFGLPMLVASYEYACGFVHLSGEHVFATNRTDDGRIIGRIVREDVDTPEANWLDLITGFSSATTLVLDVAGGWARRKTESRENV